MPWSALVLRAFDFGSTLREEPKRLMELFARVERYRQL